MHRLTRFIIDGLDDTIAQGYTKDQTWNGWEMPYFTKDVAAKVVADCCTSDYRGRYDEATDSFIIDRDDAPDEPLIYKGFTIAVHGEILHVYGIGAGDWVWDECEGSTEQWN